MTSTEITLTDGIKVGETVHKKIRLRQLTVGEELEVSTAAERLVATPNGYALIPSPAMVTFLTLHKQIQLVNDPEVIIGEGHLRKVSGRDFDALLEASSGLDSAALEAAETRGRVNSPEA